MAEELANFGNMFAETLKEEENCEDCEPKEININLTLSQLEGALEADVEPFNFDDIPSMPFIDLNELEGLDYYENIPPGLSVCAHELQDDIHPLDGKIFKMKNVYDGGSGPID